MTTTYTDYMVEEVCDDCGYAPRNFHLSVCPKCGGKLSEQVGRWIITEAPYKWWHYLVGYWPQDTYHLFIKGRENDPQSNSTQL